MRVAGVDACPGGWVAVLLADGRADRTRQAGGLAETRQGGDLRLAGTRRAATLAEIVAAVPGAEVIAVDMPLGLVETGWRQADRLAATRLGRHRSRLFMVPPRMAWEAATYQEAVRRCRTLTDPPAGFSRQAWALKEKLRQANEACADRGRRLHEVHPEISFAVLNGGIPVAAGKKTWNGQMTRRALLGRAGVRLPRDLADAGTAGADDILDAAAAAWTAGRIARGQASCLPDPPQPGSGGVPVAIWY